MSTHIYILRLHSGKFYVGKSVDPAKRYQEHLSGKGSAWTKKYKPIAMIEVHLMTSALDEDNYTKKFMMKHGIENVRGGTYVAEELNDSQLESLKKEFRHADDKCTRCGRSGHFVAKCYANTDVEGTSIRKEMRSSEVYETKFSDQEKCNKHERQCGAKGSRSVKSMCNRCGRAGHFVSNCYANTDVEGNSIDKETWVCEVCETEFSDQEECNRHERQCGAKRSRSVKGVCYRCGRPGHYSPECYARTHVKGYKT